MMANKAMHKQFGSEVLSRLRIHRDVAEPVHRQIARQLQHIISSGLVSDNVPLPGQMELARRLDVHRLTVGKAYEALEREGLLVSRKGRRSVVSRPEARDAAKLEITLGMPSPDELKQNPPQAYAVYDCLSAIEEYFRENNIRLRVLIIPSEQITSGHDTWVEDIAERDGAVFISASYHDVACDVIRRGVPCVICQMSHDPIEGVSWVSYDRVDAFGMVTEYLIKQGRRHIGYMGAWMSDGILHPKFQGYLDALDRHGLVYDPRFRIECTESMTNASDRLMRRCVKEAVRENRLGDALVCSGHGMGVAAVEVLGEAGIRVPEQVALVGNDDFDRWDQTTPPLTMLEVPRRDMGRASAELLLERLADPHREPTVRWVEARIKQGRSA